MVKASREFQIFAKPVGSTCNLDCHYCYYLKKKDLYPKGESFRMPDSILEEYIIQHIAASSSSVINFSWHGGEPIILGLDYFRRIVALQRKHQPRNQRITNGIQTNGTLLDEDWCHFLAAEGFTVGLSLDGPRRCMIGTVSPRTKTPPTRRQYAGIGSCDSTRSRAIYCA